MDEVQEKRERAAAEAFIEWYNAQNGTAYTYNARGANPPDLIYRFCGQELLLELSTAYYDDDHAKLTGQNARGLAAPLETIFESRNADQEMIGFINRTLQKKCGKDYPSGWVLVIVIYPDATSPEEFGALKASIVVPQNSHFTGIYVGGLFPMTHGFPGGYVWWSLSPEPASQEFGTTLCL